MSEPMITCPNCGTEIELTEALAAPLHAKLKAAHQAQIAQIEAQLRREAAALAARADKKAREDLSLEKQILERELADERRRREAAQRAELELRKVLGGVLVQSRDLEPAGAKREVVTKRAPTPSESRALEFAWRVAAASNIWATLNCFVLGLFMLIW